MSTSSFLKKIFLSTTFLLVSSLHSATLSSPIEIENPTYLNSSPFPCYNTTDNNYLLTWYASDGQSKYVYAAVYDNQGNVAVSAFNPFNKGFNPQCDITSCFNTKSNQYLITWYDYNNTGITYAFLDAQANPIHDPFTLPGYATSGNIYCCFNPFTKQYFLSWAAYSETNDYPPYFAIINSDGTVFKGPTPIECPRSQAGNGGTVNCCFNSSTQQYLVSWISTTLQRPFFTIVKADGTVFKNDIGVEGLGYKSVTATYNSLEKSYFLSWFDSYSNTYFSILDSKGNIKTSATPLANTYFRNFTDLYCSYNQQNNNFLLSGVSNDVSNPQSQLCLLSSKGEIITPPTILSSPDGLYFPGPIFTCFGLKNNTFLMTRTSSNNSVLDSLVTAYLQFFTQVPPPLQNSRTNKKTYFPSFTPTNPGKNLL